MKCDFGHYWLSLYGKEQHNNSSKFLLMFCMQEKNQHEWVNGHRKYIFGRTISIFDHYTVRCTAHFLFLILSLFCKHLFLFFINILFLAHNSWQNTTWSVARRQDFGRIYHEPPKKKVQKRTSGEWWRPSRPNKRSIGKPLWVAGQEEQGLCSDFCFVFVPGCVLHFIFVLKRKYFKRDRELYFEHDFVTFLLLTFSSILAFWETFRKPVRAGVQMKTLI